MYRYKVDNVVTYTVDDLVLFRESPFAVWMERLTLESPDHGMTPDQPVAYAEVIQQQQDIIETLRAEGRHVVPIDLGFDEFERRAATLAAMQDGVDFIVNGHVADGALAGGPHLLMRTSGYSDLGDFLYIPCEAQTGSDLHSAFRLSFAASLLRVVQGQLPPQLLVIRRGTDLVPLQTEDHIYYYWAVQRRFLAAMKAFRSHCMPDPGESSHFGRWSACASDVLKQQALRERPPAAETPAKRATQQSAAVSPAGDTVHNSATAAGKTLAEQARLLQPDRYRAALTPERAPDLAQRAGDSARPGEHRRRRADDKRPSADATLQDLEFIGRLGEVTLPSDILTTSDGAEDSGAPTAALREQALFASTPAQHERDGSQGVIAQPDPDVPRFLPPDQKGTGPAPQLPSSPLDAEMPTVTVQAMVDRDGVSRGALMPRKESPMADTAGGRNDDGAVGTVPADNLSDKDYVIARTFSDSLNTSENLEEF